MNFARHLLPAAVLVATLTTVTYAETPAPASAAVGDAAAAHRWHGRHGAFQHVLRELNLTPDQKAQIQSIFAQAKPQMQALRSGSRSNRELLATTPPTDPGYAALVATEQSSAAARVKLRTDLWGQIYAVLTPAQQAAIPGIVATQKAKWEARKAASEQHSAS